MTEDIDYASIGNRIRIARLQKGLTQAELGAAAGCSNNHMSHIETGQTKVSLTMLLRISKALECNIDFFLFDTPYILPETLAATEVSQKLRQCTPQTLITVNKMLDVSHTSQPENGA